MTTSGSTNFVITRDELIADILQDLGVLEAGGTPTSDQLTFVGRRLNILVKAWSNYGCQFQTNHVFSALASLTASTASYTVGETGTIVCPRPVRIQKAWIRDSSNTDLELTQLERNEYFALAGKAVDTGSPTCFYYDPYEGASGHLGRIYLYPIPSSSDTGYALWWLYQRPTEDFDSSTDNPDVPQSWYHALLRQGVVELANSFGRPVTQEMVALARESLALAIGNWRGSLKQPVAGYPNDAET